MPSHNTHSQCSKQPVYRRKKQTKNLSSGNWIVCSVCIAELHGRLVRSVISGLPSPSTSLSVPLTTNNISNHYSFLERPQTFSSKHMNIERTKIFRANFVFMNRRIGYPMERSNIGLHTFYTHTLSQASRSIVASKVPWCFL